MLDALPAEVVELILWPLLRSFPETRNPADNLGWKGARVGKERWEILFNLRLVSKKIRASVEGCYVFELMQYDRNLRLSNREQVS